MTRVKAVVLLHLEGFGVDFHVHSFGPQATISGNSQATKNRKLHQIQNDGKDDGRGTIENYVAKELWPNRPHNWPPAHEKVKWAAKYAMRLQTSPETFSSIARNEGDLGERIEALYRTIQDWTGQS